MHAARSLTTPAPPHPAAPLLPAANELMTVDNTYKVPYVQLPGTGGTAAPAPAKAKEAPAKEEPKAKEEPAVEAQAPAS